MEIELSHHLEIGFSLLFRNLDGVICRWTYDQLMPLSFTVSHFLRF